MSLTWVICGAGRRVGKTSLAQRLCQLLPDAVYAKQGCGAWQPGKSPNLFRTYPELAAFMAVAKARHAHVVVESNELARRGEGDVIIFIDGPADRMDCRPDVDVLRAEAHVRLGPDVPRDRWAESLRQKLPSTALCDAVVALFAQHLDQAEVDDTGVRPVTALRFCAEGGAPVPDPCAVAEEELVSVMIPDVGNFALLCTPCDVEALAIGFAFSEGLITTRDEVQACAYRADQRCVALRLAEPPQGSASRNLIVTSSCGLCGSRNIDRLLTGEMSCGDTLRVPLSVLHAVVLEMRGRQRLFTRTGGTHAAGIFTAAGALLALGEDIGRHNALDKAVGQCLLRGVPTAGHAAVLSGRVSVELVAKAARAGLELIAAVSAPSSLAIQLAERCHVTLCGFVREKRATVYTHPHRISGR